MASKQKLFYMNSYSYRCKCYSQICTMVKIFSFMNIGITCQIPSSHLISPITSFKRQKMCFCFNLSKNWGLSFLENTQFNIFSNWLCIVGRIGYCLSASGVVKAAVKLMWDRLTLSVQPWPFGQNNTVVSDGLMLADEVRLSVSELFSQRVSSLSCFTFFQDHFCYISFAL